MGLRGQQRVSLRHLASQDVSSEVELIEVRDKQDSSPIERQEPKIDISLVKRAEDGVAEVLQPDGWRFGASLAATAAFITLAVNFGIGIWIATRSQSTDDRSTATLVEVFRGSCGQASTLNTWSHLVINVLSTCLLAGSNFCMQCLVAPTRKDLDTAHAQNKWLDIGVPSVRNLLHISKLRRLLWTLLAISSLPLHLL
jgi:hypothetical protein